MFFRPGHGVAHHVVRANKGSNTLIRLVRRLRKSVHSRLSAKTSNSEAVEYETPSASADKSTINPPVVEGQR